MSFESRWKRLLVRNGSPSPANMRVGSVLALEMEHAGRVGKLAGHVLAHPPAQDLAMVLELRQRHLRHLRAGERGAVQSRAQLLAAYFHDLLVARVSPLRRRPGVEQLLRVRREPGLLFL